MTLVRLAGVSAAVVSLALWTIVLVRNVDINVLNGWSISLGLAAAFLSFKAVERRTAGLTAITLLVLAMLPALFGGLGLLFLLPIGLLVAGMRRELAE